MRQIFGVEYLTIREAAHEAGVSPARLYQLRKLGVLHCVPLQGEGDHRWEYYCRPGDVLEALATPLPRPAAAMAAPKKTRSLAERDAAARKILREQFGMRV